MTRIIKTGPKRRINVTVKRELLAHRAGFGANHSRVGRPDARVMQDPGPLLNYTRMLVGGVLEPITGEVYLGRIEEAEEAVAQLRVPMGEVFGVGGLDNQNDGDTIDESNEGYLYALQYEIINNLESELQAVRDNQKNDPFGSNNLFTDTLLENVEGDLEDWPHGAEDELRNQRSRGDERNVLTVLSDSFRREFVKPLGEEIVGDLSVVFIVAVGSLIEKAFGTGGWIEVVSKSTGEVLAQYFIEFIPDTNHVKQRTLFKEFPNARRPFPNAKFEFGHRYLNTKASRGVLARGVPQMGPEADAALAKQNVDRALISRSSRDEMEDVMPFDAFEEMYGDAALNLNKQIRAKLRIED